MGLSASNRNISCETIGTFEVIRPTAVLLGSLPRPGGAARLPGQAAEFTRRHALFGVVLLAAIAVRVIAMLGYPGPLLYPDSGVYMMNAMHLSPGPIRPAGYPMMLRLLEPLHSLAAVIEIQHAMGLTAGVLGYALLRRRFGLPGWGATLAMLPVLASAYAIQIEHFLLSDTLFGFLVMIAVVVVLWRPVPPLWAWGVAGLLLAAAGIVRTQGTPLLIAFVVCLLVRFAGWRTVASVAILCAAFALPTLSYAGWFDLDNGSYQITNSAGPFLYAEITTFANCAAIHPPASERLLCPVVPARDRVAYGPYYLWGHRSLLDSVPGGEFGNKANALGLDFSLRAIRAQPLDYLRAVGENFGETFIMHTGHPRMYSIAWAGTQSQLDYMFPAGRPMWTLSYDRGLFVEYDGSPPDLRQIQPYAGWIQAYQRYVVVSGPLLGLIVLTGLAGLIISWRRVGGPALLPWLTGMALLAAPDIILFDVRFLVCAVPPLCVAAGIAVPQISERATRFRAARRRVQVAMTSCKPWDQPSVVTARQIAASSSEAICPRW